MFLEADETDDGWTKEILSDNLKYANECIKGYEEFIHYLVDECPCGQRGFLEEISENSHVEFIGYVNGNLAVVNNNIYITVEVPDRKGFNGRDIKHITCRWQQMCSYAVYDETCMEDLHSGYLLFPTYTIDKFYCVYYND